MTVYQHKVFHHKARSFSKHLVGEKVSELMADFGVGRNMVNSIKFWSNRCGVIDTNIENRKRNGFNRIWKANL